MDLHMNDEEAKGYASWMCVGNRTADAMAGEAAAENRIPESDRFRTLSNERKEELARTPDVDQRQRGLHHRLFVAEARCGKKVIAKLRQPPLRLLDSVRPVR